MSQMSSTPGPGGASPEGSTRLVLIALVAALAAVILVNVYVEIARTKAIGGTFVIYKANKPLSPGDELTTRDVEAVPVPEQFWKTFETAVKRNAAGQPERVGEQLLQPLAANEIITYGHFIEDPEDRLASRIAKGKRLVALPVQSDILPSLRVGMRVDIAAPFRGGGVAPDVLLVMEDVEILAKGQNVTVADDDSEARRRIGSFKTISIQVTPEQALQLSRITRVLIGPYELHIRPLGEGGERLIPGGGINPLVLEKIGEKPTPFDG